jgi:hypothetical protein
MKIFVELITWRICYDSRATTAALAKTAIELALVWENMQAIYKLSGYNKVTLFGPKRDEVTGEWRKRHNEELHDLYSSPNIVRVIKSRRMRWAGYVARMRTREACVGF